LAKRAELVERVSLQNREAGCIGDHGEIEADARRCEEVALADFADVDAAGAVLRRWRATTSAERSNVMPKVLPKSFPVPPAKRAKRTPGRAARTMQSATDDHVPSPPTATIVSYPSRMSAFGERFLFAGFRRGGMIEVLEVAAQEGQKGFHARARSVPGPPPD
jgi:hypothetical protein